MDIALGELGLDRHVVLRMSWADFWRKAYGYWLQRDQQWDRTRHILAMLYNQNRGRNKRYKRPRDIYPLVIDFIGIKHMQWTDAKKEKYQRALKAWGIKTKDDEKPGGEDPGADHS